MDRDCNLMSDHQDKTTLKKPYQPPELARYGTIAAMTRTRSGNIADNYQFNCNHQGQNTNEICGPIS